MEIPYLRYSSQQAGAGGDTLAESEAYEQLPRGLAHPLVLVETGHNLGFGRGNNAAFNYIVAKGDGDYVWLLNNDTVIDHTTLSKMLTTAQRSPGIIGSVVRYYSSPQEIQVYGGGYMTSLTGRVSSAKRKEKAPLDFITGASMMMDYSTVRDVGFFDEAIFMYFEDIEYCIRAKKRGVLCHVSDGIVYHKLGTSSANHESHFSWMNVYKSKFYSLMKHNGAGLWLIYLLGTLVINIANPRITGNKRKASKEALVYCLRSFKERFLGKCA